MVYKYAYENFDGKSMARASGTNLSISLKKSVEVSKAIKGKKVSSVINFLERVIDQKAVVPFTRYRAEMGHKRGKGIDNGGYPVNVAKEMLRLVNGAKKNAEEKQLGDNLYLLSVSTRKGSARYHYGRYSGRKMKSTNVEVIVGVKEVKKTAPTKKAAVNEVKKQ